MNVLIIGGTGILSTDVCSLAINKGYNVYILNRGRRTYALNGQASLIKCDIRNESIEQIRSKLEGNRYDVVVDFLTFNPQQMERTLEFIKDLCGQYIFISSATAYIKKSEDEIITENTPIGNPKWDYAYQKSLSEEFLKENYKKYVNHWSVVRPYVTYNETRIPYAIVADGYYWAFINRVNIGKPIVLWDSGSAKCTITNSKDFAVGVVGLFGNAKAYEEAFHVTSDERLTWKKVLDLTLTANGKQAEVIDMSTSNIIRILPEFSGILCGDKGINMLFDNSKIKAVVPEFKTSIYFADGIKETLLYFKKHKELQIVNFTFEGRIDYLCAKYYKSQHIKYR
jgi:nucleoside-diphosphate-sugar epimerase